MNENQLETFMAVVQCGSCSKAAAELHMTQPTVSYRLQTLEEELGVRLFTRIGTRMEMTAAGGAFMAEAQALLESMQETVKL